MERTSLPPTKRTVRLRWLLAMVIGLAVMSTGQTAMAQTEPDPTGAIEAASAETPPTPDEVTPAACTSARTVGLHYNLSRKTTWGRGYAFNCGSYDRACVILWWGHAVPPWGFKWFPHRAACRNIPVGTGTSFPTPTAPCSAGYYFAELRTWNNRSSGTATDGGFNTRKVTSQYDLTGCWAG